MTKQPERRAAAGWRTELTALGLVLLAVAPLLVGRFYWQDDVTAEMMPTAAWLQRTLQAGQAGWWSPHLFGGYPGFGSGLTWYCYPPARWLLATFELTVAVRLLFGFHLWLLARGALGLAAELEFEPVAATALAAVSTLGGAVCGHHLHLNVIAAMGWTGPILWLAARLARRGATRFEVPLLAACLGLAALAGQPHYLWLAFLGGVLLSAAVKAPEVPARDVGRRWLAACELAVLLAAVQVLPMAEYALNYPRGAGSRFDFITYGSFGWRDLLRLCAPDLYGTPVTRSWQGLPGCYWEARAFVGTSFLLLALLAGWRRPTPAARAGRWLCWLTIILAPGKVNPVWKLLVWIPPFSLFRVPARFVWLGQLGLALLAAEGLVHLADAQRPAWRRRHPAWLLTLAPAGLAAAVGRLGLPAAAPTALAVAAALLVWGLACSPPARRRLLAWAVVLVGLADLGLSWHRFADTVPAGVYHAAPPAGRIVAASDNPVTLVLPGWTEVDHDFERSWRPNTATLWGAWTFNAYQGNPPTEAWRLGMKFTNPANGVQPAEWGVYSIGWVLADRRLPDQPDLRLASAEAGAALYQNLAARPLAYWVGRQWLSPHGLEVPAGEPVERVEVLDRQPTRWEIACHQPEAGYVVLAQSLYPGWSATVDGQAAPLVVAEHLYQAVAVPAGAHTVAFTFHSPAVAFGWWVSLLALIGWAVAVLAAARRRR